MCLDFFFTSEMQPQCLSLPSELITPRIFTVFSIINPEYHGYNFLVVLLFMKPERACLPDRRVKNAGILSSSFSYLIKINLQYFQSDRLPDMIDTLSMIPMYCTLN